MWTHFVLMAMIPLVVQSGVEINNCLSGNLVTINDIAIEDCGDGSPSCTFVVGEDYGFVIKATPGGIETIPSVVTALPIRVMATYLGLPFEVARGDGCTDSDLDCATDIVASTELTMIILPVDIPNYLPEFHEIDVFARVWYNEVGANREAAACVAFKISIEYPENK